VFRILKKFCFFWWVGHTVIHPESACGMNMCNFK